MKYIAENEGLISFLTGEKSILDGKISRFDIYYADFQLNIDVYICLLYSNDDKNLKLQFQNVTEYSMYHNSDHYFYYIERYKFFVCDRGFYISFDPEEEVSDIQANDNDFILSNGVAGYFL